MACYLYICLADYWVLVRHTGIRPDIMACFFKPLLAGALCGAGAYAGFGLLSHLLSERLATVAAILIGAVIYVIVVLLLKIITKNDVFMLPKGEKIAKVLEKFHWIG